MSVLTDKLVEMGCNIEEAMGRFLDNEEFYEMCFGKFLEDPTFEGLGETLQAGNVKEAFDMAHNLKGVSANMGITPICDIVCELVEELRRGNMPANAMESYNQIIAIRDELKTLA